MNILLLGSGGREHALAWKIAQSPKVSKTFHRPPEMQGQRKWAKNVNINSNDFEALKRFALDTDVKMWW